MVASRTQMRPTLLQIAAGVGIGGTLLCVAIPAFIQNLSASKLTEPVENLRTLVNHSLAYGSKHEGAESFPPSVELTPKEVPKGTKVMDAPGTWEHLTWRALDFKLTTEHAFSYEYTSTPDPVGG